MFDHRQELAVLNNVFWYLAMFQAHELASTLDGLTWKSDAVPPPFHSNLVVLSPVVGQKLAERQLDAIERTLSPARFSMKDSYANLDLAACGYEILFGASWIWREPSASKSLGATEAWAGITSPEQLRAWEEAWWGDARNAVSGPRSRQFPTSLMSSPNHRFLAKLDGETIVAGAIANRSPGVVGLSNTFSVGAPLFDDWDGLIQCVGRYFAGVPLVGYEGGAALECAKAAGFASTGALRIWQRVAPLAQALP